MKKFLKITAIILGSILGFMILLILLVTLTETPEETQTAEETEETEPIDPYEEALNKHFSGWDGSHITLTKLIKDNMNDPKSYDHVETRYGDYTTTDYPDDIIIITKFRGANAFGGIVIQEITAIADVYTGEILEIIEQ